MQKRNMQETQILIHISLLPHGSPHLDGTQSSLFSENSTHVAMAQLACEDVVSPKSWGFWYDKAMKEANMMTGTWARPI